MLPRLLPPVKRDVLPAFALATSLLFCSSGDELDIEQGPDSYTNFDGGTRCTLARNLLPRDRDEVIAAVEWALSAGHRIKAVSSAASHSEQAVICPPDGEVLLNLKHMNRVLSVEADAMTVTVEPGAKMGDVGDALHEVNLALRNHIPLRDVTAGGVIATGAHHTSLRFPSGVHDMVVGLELIDGNGQLRTLSGEQAKGAAAHLGLLGVVVAVTFQAEPQYKLQAQISSGGDADFENQILDMAAAHDHASFSWYPDKGMWVLRQLDRVPVDTAGGAYSTSWESTPAQQSLQVNIANAINRDPGGESDMCGLESLRLDAGLSFAEEGGGPVEDVAVGYSHRMSSSTCEGLECPWNNELKIFNPEVAIAVEQLPAWMADVRALHLARPICFPINGIVIRFSKAGQSWLGMNADHDVAYVEWHIVRHPDPGHHEQFAGAYDEIHQMTLTKYGGRPHWGKNYRASFVGLNPSSLYARWDDFIALKSELDPGGVFENPFWQRVTGEVGMEYGAGCAVERGCWCEQDDHCGAGRSCQPGIHYEQAQVCRK